MKFFKAIYSIFSNKCPRCHHGDVFKYKNPYNLSNLFNMYAKCRHCGLLYEKETGFFYGAMYASYGLAVGWFILWYAIQNFFLNLDTLGFAIGLVVSIVLMSPLSLRWSRLIWLNLFYSYDPKKAETGSPKEA
jgi:hypothetical protein